MVLLVGAGSWSTGTCGPIFEERGTLSVGVQGQYGYLVGDAPPADDFDQGAGYDLRLRYYLGNDRALGISMESQKFDAVPQEATGVQPREMTVALMTLDYLFYFQRASTLSRYVTAGVGVHHPSRDFQNGSEVGPDGLVLTVGAGLEYFFHRVASVDVCVRGYGLFGQGGLLGSGEAAIGLNFYIVD
jgi:opacity protein-like surface antigen